MRRAAVVLTAAAAIAWLAAAIGAARAQDELARVVATEERPDPARLAALRADAEAWVFDRRPTLIEATGLVKARENAAAVRRLTDLLASEPENAEAWQLLVRATTDPAVAERARARVRVLAPPVPPP
jgi:hypothetical protein